MKKRRIDAGILAAVFVVAVIVFGYITNRGNVDRTADLGSATLPTVSFACGEYGINTLSGYTKGMDIATMRDTITPVIDQNLEMSIEAYDREIESVTYRLYTPDGEQKLAEDAAKIKEQKASLTFQPDVLTEEQVLEIILKVDDKEIYYYTRVVNPGGFAVTECLDYIYDFHENALIKAEGAGVGAALEPNEEGDNTTLQHVSIHSDYDHVTWGQLEPAVIGAERWKILETNASYTSVQLEYELRAKGEENAEDRYKVKEFFRVRMSAGTMYLLNYDRTMEQKFDGEKNVLNANGIVIGIVPYDMQYAVNESGTVVSFVQANELWNYNRDEDQISLLFSFSDAENTDVRNLTDDHRVKLISMDKKGNTTFAVCGYMNRGMHEGKVGTAIYYYNIETNAIDEKVFIPNNKSAAVAAEEFGKLVYYSVNRDMMYILVDGTLYEIDMEKESKEKLAEGLKDGQYVVSQNGELAAFQSGDVSEKAQVTVKNLETGDEYNIKADKEEVIRPLGFVNQDFISGKARKADEGETVSGRPIIPMNTIEIRNEKQKVIKTQDSGSDYVVDVDIQDGLVTMNKVRKNGEVYNSVGTEYLANNEEKKESNISLQSYVTEVKETQMKFVFADGIEDKEAKLLKPKQTKAKKSPQIAFSEEELKGRYYVYGYGELQGVYKVAGEAIQRAVLCDGVVTSSRQEYVWEKGNRYLKHEISDKDDVIANIQKQLESGTRPMKIMDDLSDGKALDMTGCTTEQMLYVINRGIPVVGMINPDSSVILVGYDEAVVSYIDVASGERKTARYEEMDQMLAGTGRAFIGYIQ